MPSYPAVTVLRTLRQRIWAPDTVAVLAGSLASGTGAYLFQVIGTRALGDAGYAPVSVLWTIQYLVLTIALLPVEAYVTRAVALHADHAAIRRGLQSLTAWIVGVSVAVGATTWAWQDALFYGDRDGFPIVAGMIVLTFGGYVVVRGWLAGSYRFPQYGMATAAESMGRAMIALPVALLMPSPRWLAWTLPLGPFLVLVWWRLAVRAPTFDGEPPAQDRTDLPAPPAGSTSRYLTATTIANACAQTLLAAGPLVLIPLGAGRAETSVFFVTITAARAPLVFAIGGLLPRALPPLTRIARTEHPRRLRQLALAVLGAAAGLGALGALAGAWIGPDVVVSMFGAHFRPDSPFVALAAVGVVWATAALGLNQMLIAMSAEMRMPAPWVAALAAGSLTVALTSGSPTIRVATAFVVGEAVALAGLAAAVLTARPTQPRNNRARRSHRPTGAPRARPAPRRGSPRGSSW